MERERELAFLLIASVRAALKNNVRHYVENGRLLQAEVEVLEALKEQKKIVLDESERIPITTELEELVLVKKEFA